MFNWDEFKNEKIAVWCDTEEKAREFVDECYKNNITWGKGRIKEPKFDFYKENTCYNFEIDLYNSRLMFTEKSYYEKNNYKIIKWESEKMKFKVGDKIRAIDNIYPSANKKDEFIGLVTQIINKNFIKVKTISSKNKNEIDRLNGVCITHFELVEEPTEFTFQEVIARNIPGVYENCNDDGARVKSVEVNEYGDLTIKADFTGLKEINLGLGIYNQLKFKLQEPKKKVTIYKVEHKKDGKAYDFISSQALQEGMFVVCDTTQGKSYGRIVDIEVRELTEDEIKEYKECWRA